MATDDSTQSATLIQLTEANRDLARRLSDIEEEIMDNAGEVDEELDERHREALDDLLWAEEAVEEKIDAYGAVMTRLEQTAEEIDGRMDPIRDMLDNLRARRDAARRSIDNMKERIHRYLKVMKTDKVEADHFRFRRQANGGKQPMSIKEGALPTEAPDTYTRKEFDRTRIRQDLEALQSLREQKEELERTSSDERDDEWREQYDRVLEGIEDLKKVEEIAVLEDRGEHIRKY